MKKITTALFLLIFSIPAFSQSYAYPKKEYKTEKALHMNFRNSKVKIPASYNSCKHNIKLPTPNPPEGADFVNIISIGTSGNAYGYGYGGSKPVALWANPELNTITHLHRMGGNLNPNGFTGNLGYDISRDGGLTWNLMIPIYTVPEDTSGVYFLNGARQPSHAIYNPVGNINPDDAYVSFTSGIAGEEDAYLYGRGNIGNTADTLSNILYSSPEDSIFLSVPIGYVMTRTGEIWITDFSHDWGSGSMQYLDKIAVAHGTWNNSTRQFDYALSALSHSTVCEGGPCDTKVAFAPDGQTGYIAVLTDDGSVPFSTGRSYYPVLWKTTDAGQTWEAPVSVPIAGPNGIDDVKNFLSDEELEELFGLPLPNRDSIAFTTAFDFDLHVDAWGFPHIAVVIGVNGTDAYSIVTGQSTISGYMFAAAFNLMTYDAENWKGYEMGRLKTFRGTFGYITTDNRIQIASNWEGTIMFTSWLDTDLPGVNDNQLPDIWCRGYDVITERTTCNEQWEELPFNVTEYSEAMWQAYFFVSSHYVFEDYCGVWTIPLSYQDMDPGNPGEPVQYKYISNFTININDFCWVSVDEKEHNLSAFQVSQNHPNPANTTTTFQITLLEPEMIGIEVFNLMGQRVLHFPVEKYSTGSHPVTIDVASLDAGVYFYSVSTVNETVSKRMILR
nr:T9SS type A sorting domain-containing protein [Bacteroidota bacterium]